VRAFGPCDVIFEVTAETRDHRWWGDYRARLEQMFEQDAVVVPSCGAERL
jgi:hypothetical protein